MLGRGNPKKQGTISSVQERMKEKKGEIPKWKKVEQRVIRSKSSIIIITRGVVITVAVYIKRF